MPSNWLYIDTNFPSFTGEESLGDRVTTIQNYLYMLVEQLRYTLHNLDANNMNPAAAERYGLLALPGMELTTLEEAHIICLFPDLACASAFDAIVHHRLPPMVNDPAVFGPQVLMDADDRVLGEETALLAGATGIGVYEVADLVRSFGGTAFPAHIDRPSFSVLSNLGLWDPAMGFPLAEVSKNCPPDLFDRPDLSGVRHITACDAHYLDQIPDAHQYMALPERTPQAVLAWLAG